MSLCPYALVTLMYILSSGESEHGNVRGAVRDAIYPQKAADVLFNG